MLRFGVMQLRDYGRPVAVVTLPTFELPFAVRRHDRLGSKLGDIRGGRTQKPGLRNSTVELSLSFLCRLDSGSINWET